MRKALLALGAEVKVFADRALVTDSNNRVAFAAITSHTLVNYRLRFIENIF